MKMGMILLLLIWTFIAEGQVSAIQWATNLEYQHNQYQDFEYSGNQALGPPDAFPPGRINKNAFRLKSDQEVGSLKLKFARHQKAQQVIIVENNQPGRVTLVKLVDDKGYNHVIYQQEPHVVSSRFRTLVLSLPQTEYQVSAIEIEINSISAPGYCQIDAVGILESGTIADVRNILSGANFNVQQQMTFTAKKEILPGSINTKFAEAKPLVSHDGKTLYFSRLFHPDNTEETAQKTEG